MDQKKRNSKVNCAFWSNPPPQLIKPYERRHSGNRGILILNSPDQLDLLESHPILAAEVDPTQLNTSER